MFTLGAVRRRNKKYFAIGRFKFGTSGQLFRNIEFSSDPVRQWTIRDYWSAIGTGLVCTVVRRARSAIEPMSDVPLGSCISIKSRDMTTLDDFEPWRSTWSHLHRLQSITAGAGKTRGIMNGSSITTAQNVIDQLCSSHKIFFRVFLLHNSWRTLCRALVHRRISTACQYAPN